jgi:hypothetical protein
VKAIRLQPQVNTISITAYFSTKTLKEMSAWNNIFQGLKENNWKGRLCSKLSFIT